MANFEAFHKNILSSINLIFLKSAWVCLMMPLLISILFGFSTLMHGWFEFLPWLEVCVVCYPIPTIPTTTLYIVQGS